MMKRSLPRLRTVSSRPQSIVITPERSADASLASDIAKRLEEEILRGRARPGARLDERELSERYKVSRTPVREALQRLSASGLVVARGRQGLQVAQMSVADLLDALSVVAELEALACVQAARRITDAQRVMLQKAHVACGEAAQRGDADPFYDANIEFHDAIANAAPVPEDRSLPPYDHLPARPHGVLAGRARSGAECDYQQQSGRGRQLDAPARFLAERGDLRFSPLRANIGAFRPVPGKFLTEEASHAA
jgi:DNA-binding transcriptional MocR family regulator